MQDVFLFDGSIVSIQKDGCPSYNDTVDNFIKDGGFSLSKYKSIDYNRSMQSSWIDGQAFQQFPIPEFDDAINRCNELYETQQLRIFPPKVETVETVREDKLNELDKAASSFEDNLNKDMYFTSSLGFKCNGDRRTKSNLQDLITFFDLQAHNGKVDYRDYDNQVQQLTKQQFQLLLGEHVANGNSLYDQKWKLQEQIKASKSKEALKKIAIDFTMSDFSKHPVKL